jgi:two-component system sensor histidine kinase YesM
MYRIFSFMHSLKFKYMLLVAVAVLCAVFTWNFIVNKLSSEAYNDAGEYAIGSLNSVAVNMDEIMKNVDFVFTPLISNQQFIDLAQDIRYVNTVETYEDYQKRSQFKDIFLKSYISNNYIDSIYFYNTDDNIAFGATDNLLKLSDVSIQATQWHSNYEKLAGRTIWTAGKALLSDDTLLSTYRRIMNIGNTRDVGILSININSMTLTKILSRINLKKSGYAFVIDGLGNTVAASQNSISADELHLVAGMLGSKSPEGYFKAEVSSRPCLVAYHVSGYSGLSYVAVLPMQEINSFMPIIVQYMLYIFLGLLGLFALFCVITYMSFYRPVNSLFAGMRRLEAGDFSVRLNSTRKDEFGYIDENFNLMVQNLKRLIDENYIIQLNKKDAQLKIVLSQINEHFLYNTLDCIHWIAQKHKVKEISDIIFALSKFYSLSLSSGREVIKVKEIATIIQSYMSIQQMRKPDSFRYTCDVDESIAETMALKFLFQPLIENAVLHGVDNRQEQGFIHISFTRRDGLLHFEVSDNGRGISEARLREIRQNLDGKAPGSEAVFALTNIHTQIKLFYGELYGLSIESEEGRGTRVWLDIPVLTEEDARVEIDHN